MSGQSDWRDGPPSNQSDGLRAVSVSHWSDWWWRQKSYKNREVESPQNDLFDNIFISIFFLQSMISILKPIKKEEEINSLNYWQ